MMPGTEEKSRGLETQMCLKPQVFFFFFFFFIWTQGCSGIGKKDPGLIFFFKAISAGLTNLPNQAQFYIQ